MKTFLTAANGIFIPLWEDIISPLKLLGDKRKYKEKGLVPLEQGLAYNFSLPTEPEFPRIDDSAVRLLPL